MSLAGEMLRISGEDEASANLSMELRAGSLFFLQRTLESKQRED